MPGTFKDSDNYQLASPEKEIVENLASGCYFR